MATITEVKPVPQYHIAVTEEEHRLILTALTVMRNVAYASRNSNFEILRGHVSQGAAVRAETLRNSLQV